MEIISTQKFVRMSPKKLRVVASLIRKLSLKDILEILPHIEKRAKVPIEKVIKTALSNAKERGISSDNLSIKEIQITDGPRLKRGRPVSRGMWHSLKKRMSHIRVVLQTTKPEIRPIRQAQGRLEPVERRNPKIQKNSKSENSKIQTENKEKKGEKI